jgi:hypothetical protein
MSDVLVKVDADRMRDSCHISISDDYISIHFDRPPEAGRKPARMELMAAGALLGIARVLTGQAEADVVRAAAQIERREKGRSK